MKIAERIKLTKEFFKKNNHEILDEWESNILSRVHHFLTRTKNSHEYHISVSDVGIICSRVINLDLEQQEDLYIGRALEEAFALVEEDDNR